MKLPEININNTNFHLGYNHVSLYLFLKDWNIEVFPGKLEREIYVNGIIIDTKMSFFVVLTNKYSNEKVYCSLSDELQDIFEYDYNSGIEIDGEFEWMISVDINECLICRQNYQLKKPNENAEYIASRLIITKKGKMIANLNK